MKKLLASTGFLAIVGTATLAYASATLRYYNEDSKDYTWKATCSGSEYDVTFDHSKTSSVTIQGSTPCTIHTPSATSRSPAMRRSTSRTASSRSNSARAIGHWSVASIARCALRGAHRPDSARSGLALALLGAGWSPRRSAVDEHGRCNASAA